MYAKPASPTASVNSDHHTPAPDCFVMPILADSTAQLAEISDDIIRMADYRMFPVILESVLFALYTMLMIFHCTKYRHDNERALGSFAVCMCLFVLCAASLALDIWVLSLEVYRLLPSRSSPNGTRVSFGQAFGELLGNIVFARNVCTSVIFISCDCISLWRAYVIYGKPRWLKVTCCSLIVLSGVLYPLNVTLHAGVELPNSRFHLSSANQATVLWVMSSITEGSTAVAQIFSTFLIARKALLHRKEIQRLLPAHNGAYNSQRLLGVLYVVVETGVMYSLLWVLFFVANDDGLGATGNYWSNYWMCQLSGIYPTLIVVVVSQRSSILEQAYTISGLASAPIRRGSAADADVEASCSSASGNVIPDCPQQCTARLTVASVN
ncbi:unnamed protein product [Peniophora sp. CBMAI 1063]|nr:unnamed protein product [Peniophora sp. CBMAI 1063]